MTISQTPLIPELEKINIGIAWCLAWGHRRKPQFDLAVLQQMQQALKKGTKVPEEVQWVVDAVKQLDKLSFPKTREKLKQLTEDFPMLWNSKIGLIYGGATKIKQYVFEESKLQGIGGASALLDRINLVDLPAFFNIKPESNRYTIHCQKVREWLNNDFPNQPNLSDCLIPELIIYSTGGNILAFCPVALVDDLANAIEKHYTDVTLTANSCAVSYKFRLLETRFGVLRDPIEKTPWLEWYQKNYREPLVEACFGKLDKEPNEPCITDPLSLDKAFNNRKSFNELTTKLTILFNQRRSGNECENRPSRRFTPMFETHPYLRRDESENRSAIAHATELPQQPYFSEASARKRRVGNRAKTGEIKLAEWCPDWEPAVIEGWINRFEAFLKKNQIQNQKYCEGKELEKVKISNSLTNLSKVCNGFVAYIYADANNMGGYIQKIRTPKEYQEFSQDIFNATECAVYQALAERLHPRVFRGSDDEEATLKDGDLVHPFEIIAIGGDDVILIVPADKALEIAKLIGERFEEILIKDFSAIEGLEIKGTYKNEPLNPPNEPPNSLIDPPKIFHRYSSETAKPSQCQLSMSIGVLITAYATPIYYAMKLTEQLLKSAKKTAKKLKEKGYCGGTIDFLTMKSVTMISSNIEEFRKNALIKEQRPKLKLYASPYTLHEIGGLIKAVEALKKSDFPKSQLYQIRSLLERGKHTAILNYRYFRTRLKEGKTELKENFEEPWCLPKDETNPGNLAPWMSLKDKDDSTTYETIWREMVDIYEFIQLSDDTESTPEIATEEANV